ncbi:hypothetical protein AVEN_195697-1 [Araneus ventricosus]|uniref:TIL domain-containing protein n=1 Tax=Araneus ventricosus TaxID=182803 RepID=A0A4Y2B931_ARAVE|nr:hypothetical protein AVEN_195697-1 [Araneus ventricosus]
MLGSQEATRGSTPLSVKPDLWHERIWVLFLTDYMCRTEDNDPCFLQVQNGRVGCVGDNEVICEVSCDGEYQGRFHCSKDKGWKEKLPYCVKQSKDLPNITICPDKEVYSECRGHCERSCSYWKKPAACSPKVCVGACVCGEGLVRGPDGKCVSADSCSETIGQFEKESSCNGSYVAEDVEAETYLIRRFSSLTALSRALSSLSVSFLSTPPK